MAFGAATAVFSEFEASGAKAELWKIDPGDRPYGWFKEEQAPGSGIDFSVPCRAAAVADWNAGTEPFDFWFDVDLAKGTSDDFPRFEGVAVALCSKPPREMTAEDVAFVGAVHRSGVEFSIKKGPFAGNGPDHSFSESDLTKRFEINMGFAGGHFFSVSWPKGSLAGTRVRLHLRRVAGDKLQCEVFTNEGDWSRPWWRGEVAIPAKQAAIPLQHVAVIATETNNTDSAVQPMVGEVVEGRIYGFEGWTGTMTRPSVSGYESGKGGLMEGSSFGVDGQGFENGAEVLLNGAPCPTRPGNNGGLVAVAKGVRMTEPNRIQVLNPDGLFGEYAEGVYAGLHLAKVEPCEDLPAGGSIVTIRGGGFDASTTVAINGKPAAVVGTPSSNEIRVKVPAGDAGPATVAASSGGAPFTGTPLFGYAPHPYLFIVGAKGLDEARKKFNDPRFANYRKALERQTDAAIALLDTPDKVVAPDFGNAVLGSAFLYKMGGDPKYKEAFLKAYKIRLGDGADFLPKKEWNFPGDPRQFLNIGEFHIYTAESFAQAYDLLFDELTPEMRTTIENYLLENLAYYENRLAIGDWWYAGNPSNTIAFSTSSAAQVALALINSVPGAAKDVKSAVATIKKFFSVLTDDGGCVEGSMYYNYGVGNQVVFGMCLKNALHDDQGLLSDPRLLKAREFLASQLGGDGNMFSFNDTQPWIGGVVPFVFVGSATNDPLLLWISDEAVRRAAEETIVCERELYTPASAIPAFLLRSDGPAPKEIPPLPTLAWLNVLNWGVLRSAPDAYLKGLVVGVKGVGGSQTHHADEDAGSFVLQSRGESFLLDPAYFQGSAIEHSLPLIGEVKVGEAGSYVNGAQAHVVAATVGETFDQTAIAPLSDCWEAGPLRSMTVDSTAAYHARGKDQPASRVRRVFVMTGEKAVVVLDQVEPVKAGDSITTFFQAGFPAKALPGDRGFRIEGEKSDLVGLLDGPNPEAMTVQEIPWRNQWIFARMGVKWNRISSRYPFDARQPRVTVLLPVGKGEPAPDVKVTRGASSITVAIPGAAPVGFNETGGLWKAVQP